MELRDHVVQGHGRDEAQVQCARHGQVGFGLELVAAHMEVDFLMAEFEGLARHGRCAADKALQRHAHDAGVEVNAAILIEGGQYQVVEVVNHSAAPFSLGWSSCAFASIDESLN